jgi:WD40 repeat protein
VAGWCCAGHTDIVVSVAVAPDGTWLATTSDVRVIRIWDVAARSIAAITRVDSSLQSCAWNLSGRFMAALGDAGNFLFAFIS